MQAVYSRGMRGSTRGKIPSVSMSTTIRPRLANFAIALAAGAAMLTYATAVVDPGAAAESRFLGVWATLVLVAMAGLVVLPAIELAGAGDKLDAFLQSLDPVVIIEVVRSGVSGIARGERALRI